MAPFITDGSLLAYEPELFTDLPFAALRTLKAADGALEGAQVHSAAGGFSALAAGDVMLIRGGPADRGACFAIQQIEDDSHLLLERARAGLPAVTGLTLEGRTLKPLIQTVHAELLRALGMDPDDPDAPDQAAILSIDVMRELESLGTLSRAFAAAVVGAGMNGVMIDKARAYQARFAAALRSARVLLDTDGDGKPDVWRMPGVVELTRW